MTRKIFCPNCGDPSPVGQKFCEMCGTKLPQEDDIASMNSTHSTNSNVQNKQSYSGNSNRSSPSQNMGGLFSKQNMEYVVKEKFWDWGSGPIYDAHGNQIGKMKRHIFSIRKKIEFREMNDQIIGAIHQKLLAFRPTYTLVDENEQPIARLEKKIFTFLQPKFYLKDMNGRILMTAIGKFMGFDFKIYNGDQESPNQLVAEIHKADRWRDFFLGGMWDFQDTYGLRVIDPNIDRRTVLGFVIAIDNVMHDE